MLKKTKINFYVFFSGMYVSIINKIGIISHCRFGLQELTIQNISFAPELVSVRYRSMTSSRYVDQESR